MAFILVGFGTEFNFIHFVTLVPCTSFFGISGNGLVKHRCYHANKVSLEGINRDGIGVKRQ